jgi:hypothetical protein
VQIVERDSLTEGYKSKFPLFHKLFLSGVEKAGETAGYWTDLREDDRVIGSSKSKGGAVLELR